MDTVSILADLYSVVFYKNGDIYYLKIISRCPFIDKTITPYANQMGAASFISVGSSKFLEVLCLGSGRN